MSRYIKMTNSAKRPVFYMVANGRLDLDRYAIIMMWAKDIDATKAENLYLRTVTEYSYREKKGMSPPGPGSLYDYFDQLSFFCYYDANEIQDAINFITNDILPSIDTYASQHGKLEPLVEKWGGSECFEDYFEAHRGIITLNPDFNEEEMADGWLSMTPVIKDLRSVLQDSLESGEPYSVYVH